MNKHGFFPKLGYWAFLNLGILMMAIGIYFFKAPNGFATGGVSGLSILLAKLLPILTQATYMAAINILLLILGVIILGKDCGFKTIFCSLMLSAENFLFETFLPLEGSLSADPLLDLVYAMLLTGIGGAIIFNCNASSGGTDIVALIIKKFSDLDVGTALLISDVVVAVSSIFIFDIRTGLFSILGLFAKVFVVNNIIESLNTCKAFTIITNCPVEIEDYIIKKLGHTATIYTAEGAYSHEERKIVLTVCRRVEALQLRRTVRAIDPHAFLIISNSSEIIGKGFRQV